MNFKQSISIGTSIVFLTSSLHSWTSVENKHGFILKSDNKTLYLGKSCDATSPQYGTGEWYWKDNEVVVSLSKKNIYLNSGSLYADGRCERGGSESTTTSLPVLPYHWIYDQNGCKHYNPKPTDNETLTWTGDCKDGYADGYGTMTWYKNDIKDNTYTATMIKGKQERKNDSNDEAMLVGAAIGVAAIGWLFGVGRDKSSSSSSSSYSSSYSEPTSQSTSTQSSNQSSYSNYQCSFKCYNFGGVTGWGKEGGSENKFIISASSNSSANKKGLAHAKESCSNMGYDGVLSQWGTGSISCKEQ